MAEAKTILITGVSSGLGRAMAEAALRHGHRVIGTVRKQDDLQIFEQLAPGRAFGRILDVTDSPAIQPLVSSLEAEVGAIDVLINNAGYGLRGTVEELKLDDLRQQFEVNVFAAIAMTQAVLPKMRERRRGHILNIASMGSIVSFPGIGAYHGSKFAILGLGDTLAKEVAPLGIHVTSVMPGIFRSDWNGRSQAHTEHSISEYDGVLQQSAEGMKDLRWGDPAELGEVVMQAIAMDSPPEHLLIGPTALHVVREHLQQLTSEIDRWQDLSYANGEG